MPVSPKLASKAVLAKPPAEHVSKRSGMRVPPVLGNGGRNEAYGYYGAYGPGNRE